MQQAPGLGDAFLIEALSAAERIARYPEAWQALDKDVRRCRLNRFPYGLIYAVEDGDILVLAVAHLVVIHVCPHLVDDLLKAARRPTFDANTDFMALTIEESTSIGRLTKSNGCFATPSR